MPEKRGWAAKKDGNELGAPAICTESPSMDLDALAEALMSRCGSREAIISDLLYIQSGVERLGEATDIPSARWSSGKFPS